MLNLKRERALDKQQNKSQKRQQDDQLKTNSEIAKGQKRQTQKNDTSQTQGGNNDLSEIKNDLNIPQKLRDIIDDPDDLYEVFFKTDSELMDIFENLEEKNLFLI